MKAVTRTQLIVAMVIVGLIGYDAYTIIYSGIETSVSQIIIEWCYEYPIFTFSLGVLFGHLVWQMKKKKVICPVCKKQRDEDPKLEE